MFLFLQNIRILIFVLVYAFGIAQTYRIDPNKDGGVMFKSSYNTMETYKVSSKTKGFQPAQVAIDIKGSLNTEIKIKRCGVNDELYNGRTKRYAYFGKKIWDSRKLTYKILSFPSRNFIKYTSIEQWQKKVEIVVQQAFKFWSRVVDLTFEPTTSDKADINIQFLVGDHGDDEPFPLPESEGDVILAHALPPGYGDVHFNDFENWALKSNKSRTTNLLQVAVHEFGHVLGLDHSHIKDAVMYEQYTYRKSFKLHQDDIDGITSLYGKRDIRGLHKLCCR